MTVTDALIAYTFAATLLTLTPGLDTALILRTAAAEGGRKAFHAAALDFPAGGHSRPAWHDLVADPDFRHPLRCRRAEKAGRRAVDGQGYGLPVSAVCD